MALFRVSAKQDRRGSFIDRLLNTKNVVDYYMTSDGQTVFYYDMKQGRRDKTIEFLYDGARSEFRALLDDTSDSDYLTLTVDKINNQTPPSTRYEIKEDNIVEARSKPGTKSSYLYVARGAFEIIKFEVPYTLGELNSVASVSGSFSFS